MSEQYWVEAEMIKNWDKDHQAFNIGYRKGFKVYVANTSHLDAEGRKVWRVFNGNHHFTFIDMTEEVAKTYIRTKRIQGRVVKAQDQKSVNDQYRWMMES